MRAGFEASVPGMLPAGGVVPATDSSAPHAVESHNVAAASAGSRPGLFFHTPAASKTNLSQNALEFDIQPSKSAPDAEIDLSGEWDGPALEKTVSQPAQEPAAVEVQTADTTATEPEAPVVADLAATAEIIEEIRFYLSHSLLDLAQGAFAKFEQMNPDPALASVILQEMEAARMSVAAQAEEVGLVSVEESPAVDSAVEQVQTPVEAEEAPTAGLGNLVSDLESSLGSEFLSAPAPEHEPHEIHAPVADHPVEVFAEAAPAAPDAPEIVYSEVAAEPQAAALVYSEPIAEVQHYEAPAADALGSIVSELEATLGDSFLTGKAEEAAAPPKSEAQAAAVPNISEISIRSAPSVSVPAAMAAAAPGSSSAAWQHSTAFTNFKPPVQVQPPPVTEAPATRSNADVAAGIDLADMFGELKHELEEDAANTDQDPETHYSLGVAFREMGLLDEAIGELQKVCQTVEHGHPFPQILQTYTWLAQCFLDKGIPEAALRWYERALTLPTLDGETRMALHYELACAYETAGNKGSALNHFMEVYGSNIDYRDVAERIKALKS